MRFQERDGDILQAIYEHDGVMAKRQIMELFWPGKSSRAMEKRLAKLHQMGYIAWPDREQRRTRPIPEPIIWVNWKGIIWIAGRSGLSVKPPKAENENQLRKLEKCLREKGIHWVREPRWSQLVHDLVVVDFRLIVEKAIKQTPSISLEEWVNEGNFHSKADVVEYDRKTNGTIKQVRKRVIPDGYFAVLDKGHLVQDAAARV
ncbi:MAG TPA: replication-relaxation family protein, partial [Anaerovoracaceae bacterium]|nr:replication-relaxation family protein [Anaerovoracaceae bacterium]